MSKRPGVVALRDDYERAGRRIEAKSAQIRKAKEAHSEHASAIAVLERERTELEDLRARIAKAINLIEGKAEPEGGADGQATA